MNATKLNNKNQYGDTKTGKNDRLEIASQSSEDHLNTLADIIIERILEERNKNATI